jgi:TRAP-type transport system small permease protein
MSTPTSEPTSQVSSRFTHITNALMAASLGVMAVAVFVNVVLRYGFGSGVAASEELSRLLFVWMSTWRLPVWWAACKSGQPPWR